MNFEGCAGWFMLVSFNCDHCTAVLSIPEEQSGISGPCPFCGMVVTSPRQSSAVAIVHVQETPPVEDEPATAFAEPPRVWRHAQMMSAEETILPMRPRRIALKVAACAAIFVGGVAGTWRLWHGNKPPRVDVQNTESEVLPVVSPRPRPAITTATAEPVENLPPPSDQIPATPPPAPVAVARNVSTAPSRAVAVQPVSEPATLFPDAGTSAGNRPQSKPAVVLQNPGENANLSAEEKEIRRVVSTQGALAAAGTTLVRFFAAKNWQERIKYVVAADRIRPLMESYYKVNKDGPIVPEDIELMRMDPVEDDPTRHYYAFLVYFPGRADGVPISVEETKAGCLVEWSSFTEGKDMLLEKFYQKYRKEPGTFRALVRRGHYFESDVPDQKSKMVFDINPPDRTGPYKLWLDKDSVLAGTYFRDDKLGWNSVTMMVLTLQWERTPDGVEYVRLRDVAGDSWHPEVLTVAK